MKKNKGKTSLLCQVAWIGIDRLRPCSKDSFCTFQEVEFGGNIFQIPVFLFSFKHAGFYEFLLCCFSGNSFLLPGVGHTTLCKGLFQLILSLIQLLGDIRCHFERLVGIYTKILFLQIFSCFHCWKRFLPKCYIKIKMHLPDYNVNPHERIPNSLNIFKPVGSAQ